MAFARRHGLVMIICTRRMRVRDLVRTGSDVLLLEVFVSFDVKESLHT